MMHCFLNQASNSTGLRWAWVCHSVGALLRLSENARALFFLGRTGVSSTAALKGITARFRQPDDCCPRTRHVWGTKAKPLAAVPPTALLFGQALNFAGDK